MTPTQKLNRDIQKLANQLLKTRERFGIFQSEKDYWIWFETAKKQFIGFYENDPVLFSTITKESLKTMIKINLEYRFVELHQFCINITI